MKTENKKSLILRLMFSRRCISQDSIETYLRRLSLLQVSSNQRNQSQISCDNS
ncbi:hypothetical protein pb186bvf_009940 [Paramecium bursaria]